MFRLPGSGLPRSGRELADALSAGLAEFLALPRGGVVNVAGDWPNLSRLEVDLSGAQMKQGAKPPLVKGRGEVEASVYVDDLRLLADPIYQGDTPICFDLAAHQVRMDFCRDSRGSAVLVLGGAAHGQIDLRITQADLRRLLLDLGNEAAAAQGVTLEEADLTLSQLHPRSIGIELRVKARKGAGFFSAAAAITLRGVAEIDHQLNARLSQLTAAGEGMIGKMAESFLRPQLQRIEGRAYPLAALALGDLRLRDVQVEVSPAVHLTAQFGEA